MEQPNHCNSQVAATSEANRRPQRPWTNREVRYLSQHRTDGAELVAHALHRTVPSVKAKAHQMGVSLRYSEGDICPLCGVHTIRRGTNAASHRMCPTCWEQRKADAMRERAAEERARRDYDAAKHRLHAKGRK